MFSEPEIEKRFSIIAPAAGKGTRMETTKPKALIFINDETLLSFSTNEFRKIIRSLVLITSKEFAPMFRNELEKIAPNNFVIGIQEKPTGSAMAALIGLENTPNEYAIVIWPDHVGARFFPVELLIELINMHEPELCIPIIWRENPYVYFDISSGKIEKVNETIKGAPRIKNGFSDVGVFVLKKNSVLPKLKKWVIRNSEINDLNLLSFFCSEEAGDLKTYLPELNPNNSILSQGVNSKKELQDFINRLPSDNRLLKP